MEAVKKMQKDGELTEDALRDAEGDIQKLTDKYITSVDQHLSGKEAKIMKV